MNALAVGFLWLIPLAFLPVIIHLLNRLRYRTVHWAAMMFLRSADRDASRRARIRQWIILALRCLMLLMFILALSRLQSLGRLARFFDPGSNLVIVMFDRSVSMEQQRGGSSGRERALSLVGQGLDELSAGTRVIWMDGATGELIPIPTGIDPSTLPQVVPTSGRMDLSRMLQRALEEVARADVAQAEIWIPTDRQASAWIPDAALAQDWTDWIALQDRVRLRVLDVARIPADPGNRALQLVGPPEWSDAGLRVELALKRDTVESEAVPLRIETGGLSFQEDLLIEGETFQWVQTIPTAPSGGVTHARFSLPADSNARDNDVVIAWEEPGILLAGAQVQGGGTTRLLRASVLPRPGVREWKAAALPTSTTTLWFADWSPELDPAVQTWVEAGGVLVRFPRLEELPPFSMDEDPLEVEQWSEATGVLATRGREPIRLDLLTINTAIDLPVDPGVQVLATLTDGRPLLTRTSLGRGVVYDWATLPDGTFSNLDDGFVLVPAVQRMLTEASTLSGTTGIRLVGDATEVKDWSSMESPDLLPVRDAGRYRVGEDVVALNRPLEEDVQEQLSVKELQEWAAPLQLGVFEDTSEDGGGVDSRSEFTGLLALLGLAFLVAESWLLTRNIRRVTPAHPTWEGRRV